VRPRFAHADITRLDATLVRLFGWGHAVGHKDIVRLFQRFDQASATRVQASSYRWLFDKLQLNPCLQNEDCITDQCHVVKMAEPGRHALPI